MSNRNILNYEQMLEKYPNWELESTHVYGREETPELTENSRLSKKAIVGQYVKFLQDHDLVIRHLCESAPEIPDNLIIYLRDVTSEGHTLHVLAYMKWLKALDRRMGSNPEDVSILEKSLTQLRASRNSS